MHFCYTNVQTKVLIQLYFLCTKGRFGCVFHVQLEAVLMPVVVWVHGGSFEFGSGGVEEHDPEYWMRHDVVIVTFNYRLGVLGQSRTADIFLFKVL